MISLGIFTINDYVSFAVQAHDTSGSAANLDSGSFSIDFYESDPTSSAGFVAMTTPDTTFNAQIDSKTGLYGVTVRLTSANGFEAGKQYMARVGEGTVDSQTPATIFFWQVAADGADIHVVLNKITNAIDEAYRTDVGKINGKSVLNGRNIDDAIIDVHAYATGAVDSNIADGTQAFRGAGATTRFTYTIDDNADRTVSFS